MEPLCGVLEPSLRVFLLNRFPQIVVLLDGMGGNGSPINIPHFHSNWNPSVARTHNTIEHWGKIKFSYLNKFHKIASSLIQGSTLHLSKISVLIYQTMRRRYTLERENNVNGWGGISLECDYTYTAAVCYLRLNYIHPPVLQRSTTSAIRKHLRLEFLRKLNYVRLSWRWWCWWWW